VHCSGFERGGQLRRRQRPDLLVSEILVMLFSDMLETHSYEQPRSRGYLDLP
jgi:hypothetical protein